MFLAVAAPASEMLQGFSDYSPPSLLRGLIEVIPGATGGVPIIKWVNTLFVTVGLIVLLFGHADRAKGLKGNELFDSQVRTLFVLALMFMGGTFIRLIAEGANGIMASSGVGTSMELGNRMLERAQAFPELMAAFDIGQKADAALQQEQDAQKAKAAADAAANASDGTVHGWFKARWTGIKNTIGAIGVSLDKLFVKFELYFEILVTSIFKEAIIIFMMMFVVIPSLIVGGFLMWAAEFVRYFLLVVGAATLPLFIAGFGLREGHPFKQSSYNFVMSMVGYALWPVAWTLGHSVTIELFNAWVSLLSGTSAAGGILKTTMALDSASTMADKVHVMEGFIGDFMAGGTMWILSIPLGAIGIFCWIVAVVVFGPMMLKKMIATGEGFAAGLVSQAGSSTAQVAGSAMKATGILAPAAGLMSQGMGEGLSALGSAISSASQGVGSMAASAVTNLRQQQEADSVSDIDRIAKRVSGQAGA